MIDSIIEAGMITDYKSDSNRLFAGLNGVSGSESNRVS